jgi:hypothetical protein
MQGGARGATRSTRGGGCKLNNNDGESWGTSAPAATRAGAALAASKIESKVSRGVGRVEDKITDTLAAAMASATRWPF